MVSMSMTSLRSPPLRLPGTLPVECSNRFPLGEFLSLCEWCQTRSIEPEHEPCREVTNVRQKM